MPNGSPEIPSVWGVWAFLPPSICVDPNLVTDKKAFPLWHLREFSSLVKLPWAGNTGWCYDLTLWPSP